MAAYTFTNYAYTWTDYAYDWQTEEPWATADNEKLSLMLQSQPFQAAAPVPVDDTVSERSKWLIMWQYSTEIGETVFGGDNRILLLLMYQYRIRR